MGCLKDFTHVSYIKKLKSRDKFKAIEELAMVFKESPVCSDIDEFVQALIEREKIMSTGIGFGIAIPHVKLKSVSNISFALGISKNGINFDSLDGKPVSLIILVAAGEKQHNDYLNLLSKIMSVLKDQNIRKKIKTIKSSEEIINIFDQEI